MWLGISLSGSILIKALGNAFTGGGPNSHTHTTLWFVLFLLSVVVLVSAAFVYFYYKGHRYAGVEHKANLKIEVEALAEAGKLQAEQQAKNNSKLDAKAADSVKSRVQ